MFDIMRIPGTGVEWCLGKEKNMQGSKRSPSDTFAIQ